MSRQRSLADAAALRGVFPGEPCNATRVRTYVTPTPVCAQLARAAWLRTGFDSRPEPRRPARRPGARRLRPSLIDKASGKLARRPELDKAVLAAREGDQLVITKLDRLGRSLST